MTRIREEVYLAGRVTSSWLRAGTHWQQSWKSINRWQIGDTGRLCRRFVESQLTSDRGWHCRQTWTRATWSTSTKVGDFCLRNVKNILSLCCRCVQDQIDTSTKSTMSNTTLSPVCMGPEQHGRQTFNKVDSVKFDFAASVHQATSPYSHSSS